MSEKPIKEMSVEEKYAALTEEFQAMLKKYNAKLDIVPQAKWSLLDEEEELEGAVKVEEDEGSKNK